MVKETFYMPFQQIRTVKVLEKRTGMHSTRFNNFMTMIKSTAKMHLDCGVRPEGQDPAALRRFMQTVHAHDPSIAKDYEESWPVMAYLEIYLLGRIRAINYARRHRIARKRDVKCPDPIWRRFPAVKRGAAFERNRFSGKCPRKNSVKPLEKHRLQHMQHSKSIGKVQNRGHRIPKRIDACKNGDENNVSQTKSDVSVTVVDITNGHRPRSNVAASADPVLDFLSSVKPNLRAFHSNFVDMGFTDGESLDAFFSWPIDVQESTMRIQLEGIMSCLQLTGLLVALRSRKRALLPEVIIVD
ncbi:hypothetical protein ID866_7141 [Astraeus odoratus]|nr:hypothetical protein ID866_7141 [Astraeus odoratus]